MFLPHFLQKPSDSDKILPEEIYNTQYICFPPHLNSVSILPCSAKSCFQYASGTEMQQARFFGADAEISCSNKNKESFNVN